MKAPKELPWQFSSTVTVIVPDPAKQGTAANSSAEVANTNRANLKGISSCVTDKFGATVYTVLLFPVAFSLCLRFPAVKPGRYRMTVPGCEVTACELFDR